MYGYVLCCTGPENQLLSSRCSFHSQGPRTAAGVLAVISMSPEGMRGPSALQVTGGNVVSPVGARGAPRDTCVLAVSCLGDGCWASKMVAAPQPLVIQGAPRMWSAQKVSFGDFGVPWGSWKCREASGEDPPGLSSVLLSPEQGSTLRKRKVYEEFLSKVSILGRWLPAPHSVSVLSEHLPSARPPPHVWPARPVFLVGCK